MSGFKVGDKVYAKGFKKPFLGTIDSVTLAPLGGRMEILYKVSDDETGSFRWALFGDLELYEQEILT